MIKVEDSNDGEDPFGDDESEDSDWEDDKEW